MDDTPSISESVKILRIISGRAVLVIRRRVVNSVKTAKHAIFVWTKVDQIHDGTNYSSSSYDLPPLL